MKNVEISSKNMTGERLPLNGASYLSSGYHALIILSSFLYLTRLGFSPVYFIPVFLGFAALILIGRASIGGLLLSFVAVAFLLLHSALHTFHGATVNSLVVAISLPLISIVAKSQPSERFTKGVSLGYVLALLFFAVETFVRVSNPTAPTPGEYEYHLNSESTWFYLYKYGSIAFVDSNLTSIALLMLLGLGLTLRKAREIHLKYLVLNYVLLALCFSRAAAIGILISLFLGPLKNRKKLAAIGCVGLLFLAFIKLETDPSFGTKFVIYLDFWEAIQSFSLVDFMMGKGFGWFLERFGMASHSIFIQSVIEGGLIYTLLFIVIMRYAGAFKSEDSRVRFSMVLVPSLSASIYVMTLCWVITTMYSNKIAEAELD